MATQNDNTILSKADLKAYHQKILPYLGGNFMMSTNVSDYYSTDEKVVGVWTDGKPLYQKTIIDTMPDNVTSGTMVNKKIDVSSLNIDKFANWFGMMKTSTGWCMLPHVDGSCNVTNGLNYGDSDSTLWLRNGNSFYNGATTYVTIQYTKTTDAAGSALTTPGAYDINFPNTWPANKEIYFGNGVYGYRAVDKTTGVVVPAVTSGGVVAEVTLSGTAGAEYLVDEGGVVYYNNFDKPYHQAFKYSSYANGEGAWGSGSLVHTGGITMQFNQEAYYGKTRPSFTGYYDVWFKYTK